MNNRLCATILALSIAFFGVAPQVLADPTRNPPLVCAAKASCSTCPTKDGCACGCILVTLDLGATTAWTGQTPVYLRIHSSDETASLSTPAQLKVVMGWSFKAVDGGTTAGGAPQIVRFVQPEGAELVVHFQDGASVGVPEPNNLGKSLARVQMVDAEGWATTSAPAFYDLYPGDGSVWRFLATGNTNERGALVTYTDPKGRILTMDDFGVDIVRDALGNIRQVKTLTRLADVRTLSPTHYAVTVYPLAEEPEQVADTGLYALPEHAPTRVLDVAQGESVKELLVGFQKGTGDMRQYRYVAVNGDWTLYQPSGLVEAQELYFTEDESGARRLHTIRDETGRLWSRDEYNYVSAYWGYLITNRIEGIPGDATRTTSWSYHTDGPHKDLLRETVEPTGNRIVYEYDDKNRVVRESMPLVEEETLYSYEPVDPSDPPLLCDTRPRCVVRKMQGIEIQRTYYVYGTNGVDVVERVGEQGAAYGGTNVLRTVTTYYPVTGAITDGLVQSVRHEDGTIDNYAYDLTDGVWTETVTHVHEQAPAIVPMRTTRSVRVWNALGQLVDSRTDLCTIGVEDLIPQADWTPIARLQYAYDIDGNEIRREDLAGRLWTAEWAGNCCGKVSETDWQGITTTYAYDEEGKIIGKIAFFEEPEYTLYSYDRLHRLVLSAITNSTTGTVLVLHKFCYDSLNRTIEHTDETGNIKSYYYDDANNSRYIISSSFNITVTQCFDKIGRLLSETDTKQRNRQISIECGSTGQIYYTVSDQLDVQPASITMTSVDMFGRVSYVLTPSPTGFPLEKHYKYNKYGKIIQVTTIDAHTSVPIIQSLYSYDETGILDQSILDVDFDGQPDYIGQDRIRSFLTSFSVTNNTIYWNMIESAYNSETSTNQVIMGSTHKRLTNFTNGVSENITTDKEGRITTETVFVDREIGEMTVTIKSNTSDHPNLRIARYGSLFMTVSSSLVTNVFEHDEVGRIISNTDDVQQMFRYSYDDFGRLSSISNQNHSLRQFNYNALGRLSSSIDGTGVSTDYYYDEFGRTTRKQIGNIGVCYEYDGNDKIAALWQVDFSDGNDDGALHAARWFYDSISGTVTNRITTSGTDLSFEYTADGKIKKRISGRGIQTWYYYNNARDISKIEHSDSSPPSLFTYDRLGRIVRAIVEGVATNEYSYIGASSKPQKEWQNGLLIAHEFNATGDETKLDIGGKHGFAYSYDSHGRLAKVVVDDGKEYCYFRRPGSDLIERMESTTGFSWQRNYYAGSHQVLSITNTWNGAFVGAFQYELDESERIKRNQRLFLEGDWKDSTFAYDEFSQITNSSSVDLTESITYAKRGNRKSVTQNGVTSVYLNNWWGLCTNIVVGETETAIKYDLDGNVILLNGWVLEWDAHNRLIAATKGNMRKSFVYDYLGRLISYSDNAKVDRYYWDEMNIVFRTSRMIESGETNEVVYCWGCDLSGTLHFAGGVGGLLQCSINGEVFNTVFDALGNLSELVDTNGCVRSHIEYSPYGQVIRRTGALFDTINLGFASRLVETDLELNLFPYRVYAPRLGQWLSQDPIGESDDENLYRYCRNNPLNLIDPFGLASVPWNGGSFPTGMDDNIVPGVNSILLPFGFEHLQPNDGNLPPYLLGPIEPVPYLFGPPRNITQDCVCLDGMDTGLRQLSKPRTGKTARDNQCTFVAEGLFHNACVEHDLCYSTCRANKSSCDLGFLVSMKAICFDSCSSHSFLNRAICMNRCNETATMYYLGVVLFGDNVAQFFGQSFSQLQDAYCEPCCCR